MRGKRKKDALHSSKMQRQKERCAHCRWAEDVPTAQETAAAAEAARAQLAAEAAAAAAAAELSAEPVWRADWVAQLQQAAQVVPGGGGAAV